MNKTNPSLSLGNPYLSNLNKLQKTGAVLLAIGFLALIVAAFGAGSTFPFVSSWLSFGLITLGGFIFFYSRDPEKHKNVDNDHVWFRGLTAGGASGWIFGIVLTGFYVLLYWFADSLEHLITMLDPLSEWMRGKAADKWFLYGTMYTMAVVIMGYKAIKKYRHSCYQVIRTISVMFFQLGFAFLIPSILMLFNQPEFYFHYFWPLKYDYLFPSTVNSIISNSARLGVFMVFWGGMMTFIATPFLTYFLGKRWYCSWVCGCGGLANTAGDDFRQLSDKSLKAWKVERWIIYSTLVLITVTTAFLWINSYAGGALFGKLSGPLSKGYGFFFGLIFSGVVGVGFYPLMGTRVWCRFGCPMAAILGIQQRFFSRFRITTNGDQCISCGNCSTYCEMGIDVKWYAQRGQNIVRASCVGCGMCSTVCPRGVLNLENGPLKDRINK